MTNKWHATGQLQILEALNSAAHGLGKTEADQRRAAYGYNVIAAARATSLLRLIIEQLRSVLSILLLVAVTLSLYVQDFTEAVAIALVLLINVALGAGTEWRANRALDALRRMDLGWARVLRDGRAERIEISEVVPGDVLMLEAGDAVPADARLLESTDLQVNEASLTGESLPVIKDASALCAADTVLAERINMVYRSTLVTAGTARAVVVATGAHTEVGKLGGLAAAIAETQTPMERQLAALGKQLVWVAIVFAAIVMVLHASHGLPFHEVIELGIALAVAAVPEGLPAVATVTLALGVHRMARRNALVRRLTAVEALGAVTVVCTDKTGTLTRGEMSVVSVWTRDGSAERATKGASDFATLQHICVLANRAELATAASAAHGDPTEIALLEWAKQTGVQRADFAAYVPIGEVPFSSERRWMAAFYETPAGPIAYLKGDAHRLAELQGGDHERVLRQNEGLSRNGLRVLACATAIPDPQSETGVRGVRIAGLLGLEDPPAEGVHEAIQHFKDAGIKTVMITGDQATTAQAIARDLGIEPASVYSRVSPIEKVNAVRDLQARGEVVAMLGDGVNDAAALKQADVGVAMGQRGTDLAKETADIVLQDDRFSTIAVAVDEGRTVYANVRKFVFYLFTCNLAEIFVIVSTAVLGSPFVFFPLQILWLNLVTDTFPALSLAFEPAEQELLLEKPRKRDQSIISRQFLIAVVVYAALLAAATMAAVWLAPAGASVARISTIGFSTLALAQTFHLGNARGVGAVMRRKRAFSNRYALGAAALVIVLQLLTVYWQPLANLLGQEPLPATDWVLIGSLSLIPALFGQLVKLAHPRG